MAMAATLLPGLARAQEYPTRAPRLLIGFPPGSAADVAARVIAPPLSVALGQNIIIENRPGAGSNITTEQAVRAAPDGYTLLLGSVANPIHVSLQRDLPFMSRGTWQRGQHKL
jgi:tripartite-type tricarboxylate transporter receptor subunit TctC